MKNKLPEYFKDTITGDYNRVLSEDRHVVISESEWECYIGIFPNDIIRQNYILPISKEEYESQFNNIINKFNYGI